MSARVCAALPPYVWLGHAGPAVCLEECMRARLRVHTPVLDLAFVVVCVSVGEYVCMRLMSV